MTNIEFVVQKLLKAFKDIVLAGHPESIMLNRQYL